MKTLLLLVCAVVLSAAEPAGQTLLMTLSGSFPLRPSSFLFDEQETSLHDATMRLKQALAEPEPRLVLDLSLGFAPGLAAAEELAAVLRARPAGKHVACLVSNASDNAMVVAAACNEIAMVDAGILMVDGIAMSTDYYADALNRFGIKFRAVTSGPAKTAPESLTASQPSATAIAEHQRLLSGLDKVMLDLGTRPGLDVAGLTAVRNQAPQTAAIARLAKLVDTAVEPGEWLRNQPAPVRRFKIDREGPDLSTFTGLTAFWGEMMAGEKPRRFPQAVAVVELEGTIIDGDVSMPGYTIAGNDTARIFDDLITDSSIVAVVVRVNSPGGSADASDRIHFALRRLDAVKPVVALFDGVAASGGYYLGCAAREILVHRGTITGSIGVFAVVPDLDGMRALFGIHRHTLSTGPRADLFSTSAFTAEKEAAFRQVVSAVDVRFQSLVAGRRKIDPAKMPELAGGRVFTGEEAIGHRLADRLGDLPVAVARARELAGITQPLPMERLPRRGGLAARLGLGGVHAADSVGAALPADLRLWWRLASAGQPVVMAWSSVMAP